MEYYVQCPKHIITYLRYHYTTFKHIVIQLTLPNTSLQKADNKNVTNQTSNKFYANISENLNTNHWCIHMT